MEDDKVKLNSLSDKEADTVFDTVVAASLRTLFYILMLGSLLTGFLLMCFPYGSMQTSYDLGMYKSALIHSERAINATEGEKYVNSLLKGIELSDKFLIEEKEKRLKDNQAGFSKKEIRYAEKLLKFTEQFALSGELFDGRNILLDEYYRTNAILSYQKILLYSNKNYVYTQSFKARAILNKADKMLYGGKLETVKEVVKLIYNMPIDDLAIIYNQVLAYCRIDSQLKILYDQNNLNPFYFYVPLIESIQNFLSEAKKEPDTLKRLYLIDSAANLEYSFKLLKEHTQISSIENDLTLFKIDGLSLKDYIDKEITKL